MISSNNRGYNPIKTPNNKELKQKYDLHCKHLKLKGLQPKTIDAYARAIRRIGAYFNGNLDELTETQLKFLFYGCPLIYAAEEPWMDCFSSFLKEVRYTSCCVAAATLICN